jgi:hypothetical protein
MLSLTRFMESWRIDRQKIWLSWMLTLMSMTSLRTCSWTWCPLSFSYALTHPLMRSVETRQQTRSVNIGRHTDIRTYSYTYTYIGLISQYKHPEKEFRVYLHKVSIGHPSTGPSGTPSATVPSWQSNERDRTDADTSVTMSDDDIWLSIPHRWLGVSVHLVWYDDRSISDGIWDNDTS